MNGQFGQILNQLGRIWGQLGLNQRITVAGTTMAVLVGMVSLTLWSSRPGYSLLFGKMDDTEAAKVISYLDEAKVPYRVNHGTGTISVPSDKVHTARMNLAAKGVPRGGEGVGFEIFDRSNFGISDFVQRANYLRAVQGELSRTITQVDGVETARVMIVMPENRLLVNDKNKPTASVFVKVRSNSQLPQQTVNAIRFLVANAVEGLQPPNVSVVDSLGNVLSDSSEPDSLAGLSQTQLEVRKRYEQYLAKKAEDMLQIVLGPNQAVVRVSTEMNFESVTRTEEKFDPESQVLRTSTVNDENTDSISASINTGIPGVQINAYGETNTVASVPQNNNKMRKKVTNNQYEINKVISNMVQPAGSVTRVSAAVFIASRTREMNGVRSTTPRTPEELDKFRKIVQSALGIQEGTDSTRKDQITLEEFEFNAAPVSEVSVTLQREQTKDLWLQVGQLVLYPGLALLVIGLLWRTLKRTPDLDVTTSPMPVENAVGKAGSLRASPTVVTVEALNQLIRENPQNMTHAIRGWMSRGSKR